MADADAGLTWFVTGASSGLGRALTERLLGDGHRVAATLRRPAALDELRRQAGDRLWVEQLDVTDDVAVRRVVDAAFAAFGAVDVVVNNAGRGSLGAVEETSAAQLEHILAVNLLGSAHVIRAALPHLRAQGGGRILQVSSVSGQTTYPGFGAYHAAKWGIEGLCETLAKEVACFGIGVTIVEPGATATGFAGSLDVAPDCTAYSSTAAGEIRRAVLADDFPLVNDAGKIVGAMIDSVRTSPAPRRLPLGPDTYRDLRAAYLERLAELDAHRDLALSVRRDDAPPS